MVNRNFRISSKIHRQCILQNTTINTLRLFSIDYVNVGENCLISFSYSAFLADVDAVEELADILLLYLC